MESLIDIRLETVKQEHINFELKILRANADLRKKQQQISDLVLEIQDIASNLSKLYLHSIKHKYPTTAQRGLGSLNE